MLKKLFLFIVIAKICRSNIWDNLFSNDQEISEMNNKISHTKWKIENSYLFENYSIELVIDPVQNKSFFQMFQNEKSIFQILVNFNNNEIFESVRENVCQKIILPDLIKVDFSNIESFWNFIFFKNSDLEYTLDLSFYMKSSYYLPQIKLFYKKISDSVQVPDNILMKFITKNLELKNLFIDRNADFTQLENRFQDCELFENFKTFLDKFSKNIFSKIVENIYEKLIGSKDKESN
jgi:hypothetical protein